MDAAYSAIRDDLRAIINEHIPPKLSVHSAVHSRLSSSHLPNDFVHAHSSVRQQTLPPPNASFNSRTVTHTSVQKPAPTPAPLLLGTGVPTNTDTLDFILPVQPRAWLFFTRFSPRVTTEQISTMVRGWLAIGPDDVIVRRLTKRDVDVSTLSFVSFKIGVPLSLRDKALCADTWPPGLAFKEFIDAAQDPVLTQLASPPATTAESLDAPSSLPGSVITAAPILPRGSLTVQLSLFRRPRYTAPHRKVYQHRRKGRGLYVVNGQRMWLSRMNSYCRLSLLHHHLLPPPFRHSSIRLLQVTTLLH